MRRTAPLLVVLCIPFLLAGCARDRAGRTADFRGHEVVYDDYNFGAPNPALVLIHGWASDRSVWREQVERLSHEHRVIALDLIGHGQSDAPEIDYSMDTLAGSVGAVMDDAGVGDAILIGHSNGTPVARQFYRLHPDRTAGLVAVDGALVRIMPREMAERFFEPVRRENYTGYLENLMAPMLADSSMSEEAKGDIIKMALETPQHVLISTFEAAQDDRIWTEDRIEAPVLVVYADSPFWTAENMRATRELADDIEVVRMENVSHFLMMEKFAEFNALVLDFAERIESE